MEILRPNEQRAKIAIILIWIILALEIVSLISGYFQYNLLQIVANGDELSIETANANDLRERIIGIIYLIAYIISAVTFIQWFRRAYFNLHLKLDNLSQKESWAAVSWFLPIVNLYLPYNIMKELYYETKKILESKGIEVNEKFNTSLLGWWWTLWIINNIIGQIVFRVTLNAETLDELINSTIVSMVGNIFGIPLALITVKVIKDYSNIEPLLHEIKEEEEALVE